MLQQQGESWGCSALLPPAPAHPSSTSLALWSPRRIEPTPGVPARLQWGTAVAVFVLGTCSCSRAVTAPRKTSGSPGCAPGALAGQKQILCVPKALQDPQQTGNESAASGSLPHHAGKTGATKLHFCFPDRGKPCLKKHVFLTMFKKTFPVPP